MSLDLAPQRDERQATIAPKAKLEPWQPGDGIDWRPAPRVPRLVRFRFFLVFDLTLSSSSHPQEEETMATNKKAKRPAAAAKTNRKGPGVIAMILEVVSRDKGASKNRDT
jgi:hypothetical protein